MHLAGVRSALSRPVAGLASGSPLVPTRGTAVPRSAAACSPSRNTAGPRQGAAEPWQPARATVGQRQHPGLATAVLATLAATGSAEDPGQAHLLTGTMTRPGAWAGTAGWRVTLALSARLALTAVPVGTGQARSM